MGIYSDTDSVVLLKKLEVRWVSDKLSFMKLEAGFKKGIFFAKNYIIFLMRMERY